mgnify:FL=1
MSQKRVNMKSSKYPDSHESEDVGMCCEPYTGYAATGSGYSNTFVEHDDILMDEEDPKVGPYTMEELNARIDEAEIVIANAEKGDVDGWVTSEQMDTELYSAFPWLR